MNQSLRDKDPAKYARLVVEAQAPFRNMRLFVYAGSAVSAALGGFVFFFQILAGRNLDTSLPNFAVQAGVVALTVWLFLKENRAKNQAITTALSIIQAGGDPTQKGS